MSETETSALADPLLKEPDITVSVRQTFGLDSDMQAPAFSQSNEHVPDLDEAYRFDRDTTLEILAGATEQSLVEFPGLQSAEMRVSRTTCGSSILCLVSRASTGAEPAAEWS